jgi:hypothetical protein
MTHTEDLDHAFEIVLLLWSILFATFFQHMSWLWPREKWEGVSSFVWGFFLVPLVVVIFVWLHGQTLTDTNEKMSSRTITWILSLANIWSYSWVVSVIIDVGITQNLSELAAGIGLLVVIVFNTFLVSTWLLHLFRKIVRLYRDESQELEFWKNKGKWTYRKAQRIGLAIIGLIIALIIIYISTIRIL